MGVFSDAKITPKGNPLDTLCATLEEKMQFEEGERDLVVSIYLVSFLAPGLLASLLFFICRSPTQ